MLQEDTAHAVKSMSEVTGEMPEGLESVQQAGSSFGEISQAVEAVNKNIQRVNHSLQTISHKYRTNGHSS